MIQREEPTEVRDEYFSVFYRNLINGSFEFPDIFSKISQARNAGIPNIIFACYHALDNSGRFNILELYDPTAWESAKKDYPVGDDYLGFYNISGNKRITFPKEVLEKLSLGNVNQIALRGHGAVIEIWKAEDYARFDQECQEHFENHHFI